MLTDLSFLEIGKGWPPESETERLEKYKKNRLLFEGRHDLVYEGQLERIERVIGNYEDVVSYPIVFNFQKLISLKTADLLFGEPPKIQISEEESNIEQNRIDRIITEQRLYELLYEASVDVSRYGAGIFYLHKEDDETIINITQPAFWYPIVDRDNRKRIIAHVLAWTNKEDDENILTAKVHERGTVIERKFRLSRDNVIKEEIFNSGLIETGFKGFGVVPVKNISVSENIYGLDDYIDLDSVISELEVRTGQIAKVLDRHSNPSMTGPASAMTKDEYGNWCFVGGSYIPNDSLDLGGGGEIKYITWDAQLEANFKQIDNLLNMLYILSETGAALLSGTESGAQSGTALRLRMMSPLAKVNRIRLRFDPAIKELFSECLEIDSEQIIIKWRDGLPIEDEMETII